MPTTGAMHSATEMDSGALRLARVERRAFVGPADFLRDPGNRADIGRYLSDMVAPYGLALHDGVFGDQTRGDAGHSYGEMAEALIGAVVAADEPVDLLVLAFAIHDVRPGRATATYLSHVCPGDPTAFAICDQGPAAAYTGLRLIRDYAAAGDCRRALLLVVEQATLPYDAMPDEHGVRVVAPVPARHTGVALRFDVADAGTTRLGIVRQHPNVAPDADMLAARLAEFTGGRPDLRIVLGADLGRRLIGQGAGVRVASEQQPFTGVWWELADAISAPARAGVVLADYDPALRYLCLAAVGPG